MSAIEDRRAATAKAARAQREAAVAKEAADRALKAARDEENRIVAEQFAIQLAERVASEQANYDAVFGTPGEWIGVDVEFNGDNMGISVYNYAEYKEGFSFSREDAVAFRDFINEKIK